ncbi:probable aspartyl aminopeptidase [Tanacetum coccineum]
MKVYQNSQFFYNQEHPSIRIILITVSKHQFYKFIIEGRKLGRIIVDNAICDDDYDELNKIVADNGSDGGKPNESPNAITNQKHHSLLLQMLATGSKPDDICDFELQARDAKPSIISGAMKEFIISERLDNLCMSLCSLTMLWCQKKELEDESGVRMVALFDHEEAGSTSAQGAGSPVIFDALNRITTFFSSNP